MNVLVTGGAGYIGGCVAEELLKRGHTPYVLDTLYWGKEALESCMNEVKIIEGDCRSSKDVIYALKGIDAIIHLAGIVGEGACKTNPKAHFSSNIESTRTLINCCTDPEMDLVRDFLFASSCSVYGNVQGMYDQVIETTPTNPLSEYANAKLISERMILEKGRQIAHFHPTILRLTTVFGWAPRPRLDLVTNFFTYKAWQDKKITIHGDGQQYRSLIHVRDIAIAFVDMLETPRFMRDNKIFHIGEEENNKTVSRIAEIVESLVPGTQIEYIKDKPTDRRDYSINCQKIKNTIGWQAKWTVEEGIKDLLEKLESSGKDWQSDNYRNNNYQYI